MDFVKSTVLGISFMDEWVLVSELLHSGGNSEVKRAIAKQVGRPFDVEAATQTEALALYVDCLNELVESNFWNGKKAAFSLDGSKALIKRIPLDRDEEALDAQLEWEFGHYLISPLSEYVLDHDEVEDANASSRRMVIAVLARRQVVDFIRGVFSKVDVSLEAIDLDVFANERAFASNYEYYPGSHAAIVELSDGRMSISLMDNGKYCTSHEIALAEGNGARELNSAGGIASAIDRLLEENKIGHSLEDLSGIYLCGTRVNSDVLEELQNSYNVRIDKTNPFRRLSTDAALSDSHMLGPGPQSFMGSVGAALRKDLI